jgi:AraC-like DNA-binding protein
LHLFRHHDHPITRLGGIYTILQTLAVNQLTTSPTTAYENIDWLTQGKHYIEHYFLEQLTVEQIADKVGIERTHFTKMFTKRFNLSPMQYILQLRMNEASLLLQHTNYQIIEIAQAVGYQDISSFSKAFKRHIGVSPVRYRQQSQFVHKTN